MEDSGIINLYWQRSEKAILETSAKYGDYCRSISWNILQNSQDAEECVNDTYLHAWNAMPPDRPKAFRVWLGKIARNLSLDCYKKQRAQKRGGGEVELLLSELEDCIPSPDDVETALDNQAIAQLINSFLREQKQLSRLVFLRRYYYADSIRQIAQRFLMQEDAVKSLLFRTRQALKAYLETEGVVL